MATVTVLLHCYRLPSLTPTQFRDYCEDKHVPLVKSLLGANHPTTHSRYYTNKETGFVIGAPSSEDADLIAVITYDSREAMQQSMSVRMSDGTRQKIQADEDQFMDRSRLKLVVLDEGDVRKTLRD